MRSILRVVICAALAGSVGARVKAPDQNPTQATVLDHNEYTCENCLFGISDYYFCFDVNQKVLIGHEKVRTQMRKKNPLDLLQVGKAVPVRFDDKYIWVAQPKGKDLLLEQDYTKKIFLDSARCQKAVK